MSKFQTHPFTMGTVYCPTCGFLFSLSTDRASKHATCRHCFATCQPNAPSDEALFDFAPADIHAAVISVAEALGAVAPPAASQTAKDNRVIEEAFCERCNTHRPCRTFARQTRSADEGQTIFLTCTVCKSEWSHNS